MYLYLSGHCGPTEKHCDIFMITICVLPPLLYILAPYLLLLVLYLADNWLSIFLNIAHIYRQRVPSLTPPIHCPGVWFFFLGTFLNMLGCLTVFLFGGALLCHVWWSVSLLSPSSVEHSRVQPTTCRRSGLMWQAGGAQCTKETQGTDISHHTRCFFFLFYLFWTISTATVVVPYQKRTGLSINR